MAESPSEQNASPKEVPEVTPESVQPSIWSSLKKKWFSKAPAQNKNPKPATQRAKGESSFLQNFNVKEVGTESIAGRTRSLDSPDSSADSSQKHQTPLPVTPPLSLPKVSPKSSHESPPQLSTKAASLEDAFTALPPSQKAEGIKQGAKETDWTGQLKTQPVYTSSFKKPSDESQTQELPHVASEERAQSLSSPLPPEVKTSPGERTLRGVPSPTVAVARPTIIGPDDHPLVIESKSAAKVLPQGLLSPPPPPKPKSPPLAPVESADPPPPVVARAAAATGGGEMIQVPQVPKPPMMIPKPPPASAVAAKAPDYTAATREVAKQVEPRPSGTIVDKKVKDSGPTAPMRLTPPPPPTPATKQVTPEPLLPGQQHGAIRGTSMPLGASQPLHFTFGEDAKNPAEVLPSLGANAGKAVQPLLPLNQPIEPIKPGPSALPSQATALPKLSINKSKMKKESIRLKRPDAFPSKSSAGALEAKPSKKPAAMTLPKPANTPLPVLPPTPIQPPKPPSAKAASVDLQPVKTKDAPLPIVPRLETPQEIPKKASPFDTAQIKAPSPAAKGGAAKAPIAEQKTDPVKTVNKRSPKVVLPPIKQESTPFNRMVLAIPVLLLLLAGIGFAIYWLQRETTVRIEVQSGEMAIRGDAFVVLNFAGKLEMLRQDYLRRRSPIEEEILTIQADIAAAKGDLAGREQRSKLLEDALEQYRAEIPQYLGESQDALKTLWDKESADLSKEYDDFKESLHKQIEQRATELGLDYKRNPEIDAIAVAVNAFRLSLYGVARQVNVSEQRMWAEGLLQEWGQFETTWRQKQAEIKKRAFEIKQDPLPRIADARKRIDNLEREVEAIQIDINALKNEVTRREAVLEQTRLRRAELDAPFMEELRRIPEEFRVATYPISPEGVIIMPQLHESELLNQGVHLIFVQAARGDQEYWAVQEFEVLPYQNTIIVVEPSQFKPLKDVLDKGMFHKP